MLRVHACVWVLVVGAPHVPLEQVDAVTERDWVPVSSHVLL